ncbi:DUF4292 domain-containing protein [Mucilaginibacter boryungensis]|uniref:DUF4292 domain-containing protein n=1 Tax=Mucilaginibacter boryungensis TaxID=768480 RepID=A0ABR9XC90_9SPHI|nr:DUF4292 domain-containing protein [Mucilaginibacter boryungensis]MBE9664777.1 DUF4292 domain-containing protein [Mucilaginibacter boryungensis]
MNSRIIILIGILAVLASCKAHKQVLVTRPTEAPPTVIGPAKTAAPSVNTKLVAIRARQLNFNTFTGKAKTRLNIDGNSNDVTLNIRIQHDKKIWVSVTAILGLEIARALITPDSIIVINKLQGVYMKKPFSYIYQYGGKQLSFKSVQALLVGNIMPELLADNADVSTDNANTILTGQLQGLAYKLTVGPDFKLSQTTINNQLAALALQVSNSAFIQVGSRIMPSQIDIVSSAGNKKINAGLHYNSAEFDKELEYTFSIPDRYTPVD